MKSEISRVQKRLKNERKVEVYDLTLTARIPTVHTWTSFFLYKLLGHETKEMIMTPTGGFAQKSYGKPIKDVVRHDESVTMYIGRDGSPDRLKHTDEDTENFGILKNHEFKKQLKEQGWMFFSECEKLDSSYEKEKLHIDSDNIAHRTFGLQDLIRAIEITDHEEVDYSKTLTDLKELLPFAKQDMKFIYRTEFGSLPIGEFLYLFVNHKDEYFHLGLSELDMLKPDSWKREPPKPMRRNVFLTFNFRGDDYSHPTWWRESNSERVCQLAREYMDQQDIRYCRTKETSKKLQFILSDRTANKEEPRVNTEGLLEQACEMREFVEKAIKAEHKCYEDEQSAVMDKKRKELGIEVPAKS